MEKIKQYIIQEKEYSKLRKLANNVYYSLTVIECFCSVQKVEPLTNIIPILKNIVNDADMLNAYFIDEPEPGVLS